MKSISTTVQVAIVYTGYQTLVASIFLMGSILYKPKLITVVMLLISVIVNKCPVHVDHYCLRLFC